MIRPWANTHTNQWVITLSDRKDECSHNRLWPLCQHSPHVCVGAIRSECQETILHTILVKHSSKIFWFWFFIFGIPEVPVEITKFVFQKIHSVSFINFIFIHLVKKKVKPFVYLKHIYLFVTLAVETFFMYIYIQNHRDWDHVCRVQICAKIWK